jgi:hypothetical protein
MELGRRGIRANREGYARDRRGAVRDNERRVTVDI